jgi:hypothetical protein
VKEAVFYEQHFARMREGDEARQLHCSKMATRRERMKLNKKLYNRFTSHFPEKKKTRKIFEICVDT